jgi:kynurenine formamidase
LSNGVVVSAGALALAVVSGTVSPVRSQALDLDHYQVVDLTHPLNADAVFWPTSPTTFELEQLAYGRTDSGYFYSANSFATPEHGGTHIDAPIHFDAGGQTVDEIPVAQLMGRAVVIDVRVQAAADPDYTLTEADLAAFEGQHGDIQPGSIVLLRTGWSERWPDAKAYLGDDTPGDASNLHFPSFGPEAVRVLVEHRRIAALGADVASIDYGMSQDFMVHRIAASANVPGLENLTNLDQLPATGAWVIALPIKIEGGSGGPVRAVALVPR